MRETRFFRLTALVLCCAMLLGGMTMLASAAPATATGSGSGSGSVTDTDFADITELLNAISYSEYSDKYLNFV